MSRQLTTLAGELSFFTRMESVFMALGDSLGEVIGMQRKIEDEFAALSTRLNDETEQASNWLDRTVERIGGLTIGAIRNERLDRLDALAGQIDGRIAVQARIVNEIRALAIAGRIEATRVTTQGVDFSVFTTEVMNLAQVAEQTVTRATERLQALRGALRDAVSQQESFHAHEAQQIPQVLRRLEEGVGRMVQRCQRMSDAAIVITDCSRLFVERIGVCVGKLQFNDIAAQRIAHAAEALVHLGEIWERNIVDPDRAWLQEVSDEDRMAMFVIGARLQRQQLVMTGADFSHEVATFTEALAGLANDIAGIVGEADRLIGGGSFLDEVNGQIREARLLLDDHAAAGTRTHDVVGTVAAQFGGLEADLDAIRAVDADLWLMGLNASLKCGRLGREGLSLGVVAQELRTCSRQTDENATRIFGLLTEANKLASELQVAGDVAETSRDEAVVAEVITMMDSALTSLAELGDVASTAIERLRTTGQGAADLLRQTMVGITAHREVDAALGEVCRRIDEVLADHDVADDVAERAQHNLWTLLGARYTMDSERAIHEALLGQGPHLADAGAAAVEDDDLDAFFF